MGSNMSEAKHQQDMKIKLAFPPGRLKIKISETSGYTAVIYQHSLINKNKLNKQCLFLSKQHQSHMRDFPYIGNDLTSGKYQVCPINHPSLCIFVLYLTQPSYQNGVDIFLSTAGHPSGHYLKIYLPKQTLSFGNLLCYRLSPMSITSPK